MQSVVALPFSVPSSPLAEAADNSSPSTDGAFLASFDADPGVEAGPPKADSAGMVAILPFPLPLLPLPAAPLPAPSEAISSSAISFAKVGPARAVPAIGDTEMTSGESAVRGADQHVVLREPEVPPGLTATAAELPVPVASPSAGGDGVEASGTSGKSALDVPIRLMSGSTAASDKREFGEPLPVDQSVRPPADGDGPSGVVAGTASLVAGRHQTPEPVLSPSAQVATPVAQADAGSVVKRTSGDALQFDGPLTAADRTTPQAGADKVSPVPGAGSGESAAPIGVSAGAKGPDRASPLAGDSARPADQAVPVAHTPTEHVDHLEPGQTATDGVTSRSLAPADTHPRHVPEDAKDTPARAPMTSPPVQGFWERMFASLPLSVERDSPDVGEIPSHREALRADLAPLSSDTASVRVAPVAVRAEPNFQGLPSFAHLTEKALLSPAKDDPAAPSSLLSPLSPPGVPVTAGLPATPGQTTFPVPHVAAQITAALSQSADGATELALSPDELGHVRLRLERDPKHPDRMVVLITFERPETLDLFRRHAGELAEALRSAGFAGADIGFGQQGSGAQGSDRNPGFAGTGGDYASAPADPPPTSAPRLMAGASLDLRL